MNFEDWWMQLHPAEVDELKLCLKIAGNRHCLMLLKSLINVLDAEI